MSTSPPRRPADPAGAPAPDRSAAPGLPLVALATLAVLVTAADTYVVVLALPDILTGVGVGLDELQRATPIIGGFLLGYTATLPLLGRLADLRGRARTAGHRRRGTGAGDPRARRRPLAARTPVGAAGGGGRGPGGRRGARAA